MDVNILAVGDVVGPQGVTMLQKHLRSLIKMYGISFCIVNGENASMTGITPSQADGIFSAGADVITLGNHAFRRREIDNYLDDNADILRPANYAPHIPGRGVGVYPTSFGDVAVVNLIGRVDMDYGPDNPFYAAPKLLKDIETKIILIDFHAEATSEKLAMGYMLDGRVSAVFGTHTHVPTADEQVLPNGTGYITDLGMTGPANSVLGIKPEQSIEMFRGGLVKRYEPAAGAVKLDAAIFTIDTKNGLCSRVERVKALD